MLFTFFPVSIFITQQSKCWRVNCIARIHLVLLYYIGVISYNIFLDLFFFAFNKVMLAIKNAGTKFRRCGEDRARTDDLLHAMQAL